MYLDFNIDALRAAERECARLQKAAADAAWDAPSDVRSRSPRAQDHGRIAEAAAIAENALGHLKIVVDVYGSDES
jgi:hypothetical protein